MTSQVKCLPKDEEKYRRINLQNIAALEHLWVDEIGARSTLALFSRYRLRFNVGKAGYHWLVDEHYVEIPKMVKW